MKIKNDKTGAIVDIRKVSLETVAERLAAKDYISSVHAYKLSNTRAYSKSGYVWHSYEVFASEQADMLTKRHLLHELDTFGKEEITTLSTTVYEKKALTRFSLADICIDVNDHIIEDLDLAEDRYLENVKDQWYSITGIPKYDCKQYPSANRADPDTASTMPGEPYQVCMAHPCVNHAMQTTPTPAQVMAAQPQPTTQQTPMVDPVMAAQPAMLMGQPYVNPAFVFDPRAAGYIMQRQPYPMQMMAPTVPQVMAAQPQPASAKRAKTHVPSNNASDQDLFKISLLGLPFELRPEDYCTHTDLATGKSVLKTRHDSNGNTYKYCPICKQSWVERPITAQDIHEAYYVIKSASEYLKANSKMSDQKRKDLITTELSVFGIYTDICHELDCLLSEPYTPDVPMNPEASPAAQNSTEPDKGDSSSSNSKASNQNPDKASLSGVPFEVRPEKYCSHTDPATGKPVLKTNHCSDGNVYKYCPICKQSWAERPVTPQAMREAYYTIKSASEYLKAHCYGMLNQQREHLTATELGVFDLIFDLTFALDESDPEASPAAQNSTEPDKSDGGSSK